MRELGITDNDRILIVAPHPDDESIAMGGFICLFSEQCEVWLISDGRLGNGKIEQKEIIGIRNKEFIQEMDYLGVTKYHIWGLPDGQLTLHVDYFLKYDFSRFTKIFVPNRNDNHIDHVATFRMIYDAIVNSGIKGIEMYQYEATKPLNIITHYIDISDVIENKMRAIELNVSQINQVDYLKLAKYLNGYRAIVAGNDERYFECFQNVEFENEDDEILLSLQKKIDIKKIEADIWYHFSLKNEDIKRFLLDQKRLYVYGYGKQGKLIERILRDLDLEAIFVDKYNVSINQTDTGYLLISNVDSVSEDGCILVTVIDEADKIKKSLQIKHKNCITLLELVGLR